MAKYRKKPVVIEAIKFDGSNGVALENWSYGAIDSMENPKGVFYLQIITLEGPLKASVGDWIIRGIKSEYYPCKPDIFDATYEKVEAS